MAASGCRAGHSQPKTCYLCSSPVISKQTERHFDPRDTAAWHYLCKEPTERVLASLHMIPLVLFIRKGKLFSGHSPCGNTAKSCKRLVPGVIFILLFFNLKREV